MSLAQTLAIVAIAGILATGCQKQIATSKPDPAQASINWYNPDGTLNWEAEKQQRHIPTDTIVIHHTAHASGITWQELSAMEYQRLYVPRFKPTIPDPYIKKGTRVQSGHFLELGKSNIEVFYAYHWLIRPDGKAERLLQDNEVGWHSGNWEMNCRSIAICFDGDFTEDRPKAAAILACANLVADYRNKFKIKQVVGHFDVKNTTCPGQWFRDGGKEDILLLSGDTETWKRYNADRKKQKE